MAIKTRDDLEKELSEAIEILREMYEFDDINDDNLRVRTEKLLQEYGE